LTDPGASGVAADSIGAIVGDAIRRDRASTSIGHFLTRSRSITRQGAFIVGVGIVGNVSARAIASAAFFGGCARHAREVADVAATHAVGAIIRETLRCGRARSAIVEATGAIARASSSDAAFAVGIGFGGDVSARSIRAAAFFGGATRLASPSTSGIATIPIDAIARCALSTGDAGCSIGEWCLRLITRSRTITFAGIAFVVRIFAARDDAAYPIVPLAFFRFRTSLARAGANVAAASAVDTIPGQTLGRCGARNAIVLFAHAFAVTRAAPAFVVGVFVIGYVAAGSIGPLTFSRRGTSLARPQTPAIATYSIRAIP